jgi:hypothetical protein
MTAGHHYLGGRVQVGLLRISGLRADACSDDVLERGPEG